MQRLTDYDIYKELVTLADRLDAMADKSLSLVRVLRSKLRPRCVAS